MHGHGQGCSSNFLLGSMAAALLAPHKLDAPDAAGASTANTKVEKAILIFMVGLSLL